MLRRGLVALSLLALVMVMLNVGLTLALFGPAEGGTRLASDWRRIVTAHALGRGEISPKAAFLRIYGRELGGRPSAATVRSHFERDLEAGEPAAFDYVMARYIVERWGQIDARTLPPGVYVAAGPIGPDAWPSALATHYLVFPRHGYLLIVPHADKDGWAPAFQATASLRRRFRERGDGDELYAVVQRYAPGAYDFPKPGEPIHDLFLVSAEPADVERVSQRLRPLAWRIGRAGLRYKLLRQNSNSALACYMGSSGVLQALAEQLARSWLARIRLPGVGECVFPTPAKQPSPQTANVARGL